MSTNTSLEKSLSLIVETEDSNDDDGDDIYRAFSYIKAKVYKKGTDKAIGEISGISINRQKIAEGCFFQAFDAHSGELEWVAGSLLENRYGRTKLQSLRDVGDNPEFNFFLIQHFWIDEDQPRDVATFALRKFLHSEKIKGNLQFNCWYHSSVAFVLSEFSNELDEEQNGKKRKRGSSDDSSTRKISQELIPFLRNGFFQDTALVRKNPDNARILVGGITHFEQSLMAEAEATAKARTLLGGSSSNKPLGKDAEILSRVENLVNLNYENSMRASTMSLSSIMIGRVTYKPPEDCTSEAQLRILREDLRRLVRSGGSISRSTAVHAACEKNSIEVVKLLLQMDSRCSRSKDHQGRSPLIVAAINASGRLTINGIDDTAVIDTLLASGANKDEADSLGMTAYGYFRKSSQLNLQMTHYHHRRTITDLEHKLYPSGGPTRMDFAGGIGVTSGFVDYGPEDDEADRECGIGAYAKNTSYGDY